ncbi:MAG: DUF3352 domain-containing protein [Myxococcales bacterium]|nr:DUF3352 domain-containing protein [Myxococcales bacterium]
MNEQTKPTGSTRAAVVLAGALFIAASVTSCGGCGKKAPTGFVPDDATAVALVPSVKGAVVRLQQLLKRVQGGVLSSAILAAPRTLIERELGIDPTSPKSIREKGIDPERGLAIASVGSSVVLVCGVADEAKLRKHLEWLANRVLRGAAKMKTKGNITLVHSEGVDRPRAGFAFAKKHLVLVVARPDPTADMPSSQPASGSDSDKKKAAADPKGQGQGGGVAELLARLLTLDKTIESNPRFVAARKTLGKYQLMLYVDGVAARRVVEERNKRMMARASDWMKKYIRERQKLSKAAFGYFGGFALAVRMRPDELALRSYYKVPEQRSKQIAALLKGRGDSPPFGKYIGADALVVGRGAIDFKRLLDQALELLPTFAKRRIYRKMERLERENNFSLEKDVLSLLGNRYAGALYPPRGGLSSPPRTPVAIANAAPVALMAQVEDAKKAAALLARLERAMVMRGAAVRTRSAGERKIYTLELGGEPLVSWAQARKVIVVATGKRLDATLKLIDKGGSNILDHMPTTRSKSLMKSDNAFVISADVSKISDMLRNLDLPAVEKIALAPFFAAVAKIKSVTIAAEHKGGGVLGELSILFAGK